MKLSPQYGRCTLLLVVAITKANLSAPSASAFLPLGSPPCISRSACSRVYGLVVSSRSLGGGVSIRPNSKHRHRVYKDSRRRSIRLSSSGSSNSSNDVSDDGTVDKSRKNFIDAVVEEKVAGLAERDEENTTVTIHKHSSFLLNDFSFHLTLRIFYYFF